VSSNDRQRMELVLQHLLRRPKLFKSSMVFVDRDGYFSCEPDLDWVYKCALGYMNAFDGMPTLESLLMELGGVEHMNIRAKLKEWFALPKDHEWSDLLVQDELQDFSSGVRRRELLEAVEDADDRYKFRDAMARTMQAESVDLFSEVKSTNPFSDIRKNMETAVRVPTGVDFIDLALEGGVRKGEVIGFIVPTSGGKTTLALQIADAQIRHGKHVAYLSTEQRLAGDISVRCFTLGARTSQDAFKYGYDKVDKDILETLNNVSETWLKYFHFFDCTSQNAMDVASALNPIRSMQEAGIFPEIVILDWWGRMKDRILGAQEKSLTDNQLRTASRNLLQDLKDQTELLGVTTMVTHQMAGAVAEKGPKHKPSSHSAQEDKNFNNMMDFCFTISKKDAQSRVNLANDKARSTGNNSVRLTLDGAHCLFRMCDDPDHTIDAMMPDASALLPPHGVTSVGYATKDA